MEDKVLDICGLGCGNDGLTNGNLVRADIGSHMVNCPNPLSSPVYAGLVTQISNEHIINAKRFKGGNLIKPVYQCPDSFSAFRKRLNDRPASFASRTCDKDHSRKKLTSFRENLSA